MVERNGLTLSVLSEPPPWALQDWGNEVPSWKEDPTRFDSDTVQHWHRDGLYQWRASSWIPAGTFVAPNGRASLLTLNHSPIGGYVGWHGITVSRKLLAGDFDRMDLRCLSDEYVLFQMAGWGDDLLMAPPQALTCPLMDGLIPAIINQIATADAPLNRYEVYHRLVDLYHDNYMAELRRDFPVPEDRDPTRSLHRDPKWKQLTVKGRGIVSPSQMGYLMNWLVDEDILGMEPDDRYSIQNPLDALALLRADREDIYLHPNDYPRDQEDTDGSELSDE